jgi:hypothetical protein
MKSSLLVLSLMSLISLNAFAANNAVVLDVQIHEVITLKKVSNNHFDKISNLSTGIISLDVTTAGATKNLLKQEINQADPANALSLDITGKNIVRITDQKENINQEIQAEIDKGFFGGLNSITIRSQTLEALYAESIKKSGLDVLAALNITGDVNLASKITLGDQVCLTNEDLLICNQDIHLAININN